MRRLCSTDCSHSLVKPTPGCPHTHSERSVFKPNRPDGPRRRTAPPVAGWVRFHGCRTVLIGLPPLRLRPMPPLPPLPALPALPRPTAAFANETALVGHFSLRSVCNEWACVLARWSRHKYRPLRGAPGGRQAVRAVLHYYAVLRGADARWRWHCAIYLRQWQPRARASRLRRLRASPRPAGPPGLHVDSNRNAGLSGKERSRIRVRLDGSGRGLIRARQEGREGPVLLLLERACGQRVAGVRDCTQLLRLTSKRDDCSPFRRRDWLSR